MTIVKMRLPDGQSYWCKIDELQAVIRGIQAVHPDWMGETINFVQVEMSEEEYYRRPATNDPVSVAIMEQTDRPAD